MDYRPSTTTNENLQILFTSDTRHPHRPGFEVTRPSLHVFAPGDNGNRERSVWF